MSAIPGTIETDRQPPMTIPLGHFVVGLGFLVGGTLVGLGTVVDVIPGLRTLAHVHLLVAGWICITIMGAMTQFVPVWSGIPLHSRRLAGLQLALVTVGLVGFSTALLFGTPEWLIPTGGLMLAGFWTFVYNIARTMAPLESYDTTERHFLLSLGFFVALTVLGFLLALDLSRPVFASLPVTRTNVIATHVTIAIFGAVMTTVYGALYQLATMFTQTELDDLDNVIRPVESVGHPIGVVLLALGRFGDVTIVAKIGAVLVLAAALAFSTILARKLYEMQVKWAPMHTRYAVVVPGLTAWTLLTIPVWLRDPTTPESLFGAPGAAHLLVLGTIGFVVAGTLYHVIPFIIWVHRYSDLLGLEDVPMVDDLYDDRLAAADAALLVAGTLLIILSDWFTLPSTILGIGGGLVTLGSVVFTTNMLYVIQEHSPHSVGRILLGSVVPRRNISAAEEADVGERRYRP